MPTKTEIANAFAVFDADGNGNLSPDELKAILTRPVRGKPAPFTEEEVDQLVKTYDTDNDGQLSVEEFAQAWASLSSDKVSLGQLNTEKVGKCPTWTVGDIPRAGEVSSAQFSEVEEALVAWLVAKKVPGASLAIVDAGGRPLTARAFGVCDLDAAAPLLPTHGVGFGSIGKSIHAACLLALVDDGLLKLDDTLGGLFGGADTGFDANCDAYATTVNQCLRHTSGFADDPASLPFVSPYDTAVAMLRKGKRKVVRRGSSRRRTADSAFEYCDNIYSVLHLVIGKALERAGRTDEAADIPGFIEKRVLAPLGAADDVIWMGDARMPSMADVGVSAGRLARGYTVATDKGGATTCTPIAAYDNFGTKRDWSYGASGYTGTALGLARTMQAFGGDRNRGNSKVLKKETIDAAFTVTPPSECGLNIMPYGATRDGGLMFGHGGSNGAVAVVMPDGGAVACVVTGTLGLSGWDTSDHSQLGKVEDVLGFWSTAVYPTLTKAYTS